MQPESICYYVIFNTYTAVSGVFESNRGPEFMATTVWNTTAAAAHNTYANNKHMGIKRDYLLI